MPGTPDGVRVTTVGAVLSILMVTSSVVEPPVAVGGAAQRQSRQFIDIGIKVGVHAAAVNHPGGFIVVNFPDDADIAGVPVIVPLGAGDDRVDLRRGAVHHQGEARRVKLPFDCQRCRHRYHRW